MRRVLFFLIIVAALISCNNKHGKKTSSQESKVVSIESTDKTSGEIIGNTYLNSEIDWSITIPSNSNLYYPKALNIKNDAVPDVIKEELVNNYLVCFGIDESNYFSAYTICTSEGAVRDADDLQGIITNSINNYNEYSQRLCTDLERKYSGNKEIAFKQSWNSRTINDNNYDIYDIQMVSYPDDEIIISQLVYVRKMKNCDVYHSIIYKDEKFKNLTLQHLVTSFK